MVNTEVLAGVDDDLKAKPNKRCNLASERFENVPSGHTGVKHKVHLLDPVFVNPKSTENIMQVLRHIGKSVGLTRYGGTERSWIGLDWICLTTTRPSGHISRPTQVNVSELLLLSKQLLKSDHIVHFGG